VVLVLGIEIDVVLAVLRDQRGGSVRLGQKLPRLAAPEDAGGQRGRGIAEGRPVEQDLRVGAVIEAPRLRRLGIADIGELRQLAPPEGGVPPVAVVVEIAGIAGRPATDIERVEPRADLLGEPVIRDRAPRQRRRDQEACPQHVVLGVPIRVVGGDLGHQVDRRGGGRGRQIVRARRRKRGLDRPLDQRRQFGIPGQRRQRRHRQQPRGIGEAEPDRPHRGIACDPDLAAARRRLGQQHLQRGEIVEAPGEGGRDRPHLLPAIRRRQPPRQRDAAREFGQIEHLCPRPGGRGLRRGLDPLRRRRQGDAGRHQPDREPEAGRHLTPSAMQGRPLSRGPAREAPPARRRETPRRRCRAG